MAPRFGPIIGFDDAPFARGHRGDVPVVGTVHAGARLDGVLLCRVRRDGANATRSLATAVLGSRHHAQLRAIVLKGIALAGFNVVDIARLAELTALPVLVVSRRRPDLARIRAALLAHVPGGGRKWELIERAGRMEPLAGLHVQRAGLSPEAARALLARHAVSGRLPEALRTAHLIAGALVLGESRSRP